MATKLTPDSTTGSTISNEVEATDAREPYEAPRLETEELFEVLALACGKINPKPGFCQRQAKNS